MPLFIGPFGPGAGASPTSGATGAVFVPSVTTPAWTKFALSVATQRFNRAYAQDPTLSPINYVNVITRVQTQYPAWTIGTGCAVYVASHTTEALA